MRRATFLASVRADLLGILTYITQMSRSIPVAQGFVRQLRERCHKLAAFDGMIGRPRPELGEDIRSFPFKGYVIFFRYRDTRFEVVAIIEGHRDVEIFFGKPDEPKDHES